MAKNIIKDGWSVRKTEAEVAKELAPLKAKAPSALKGPSAFELLEQLAPATPSAPIPEEEKPWNGICRFKQDGASMVTLETFYERSEDPEEFGELVSSELSEW